jgi:hypothetical protein
VNSRNIQINIRIQRKFKQIVEWNKTKKDMKEKFIRCSKNLEIKWNWNLGNEVLIHKIKIFVENLANRTEQVENRVLGIKD